MILQVHKLFISWLYITPCQTLHMVRFPICWLDESHELQFSYTADEPSLHLLLIQSTLSFKIWLLLPPLFLGWLFHFFG